MADGLMPFIHPRLREDRMISIIVGTVQEQVSESESFLLFILNSVIGLNLTSNASLLSFVDPPGNGRCVEVKLEDSGVTEHLWVAVGEHRFL